MLRLLTSRPVLILGGIALARWLSKRPEPSRVAYSSPDEGGPAGNFAPVRGAGPASMREAERHWTREDEALDETFPASDPPGH